MWVILAIVIVFVIPWIIILIGRSLAYFRAMGWTRAERRALYSEAEHVVEQAVLGREFESVAELRPVLERCIPQIADLMVRRRLVPVPHAVMHLLARSLNRDPSVAALTNRELNGLLWSIDDDLKLAFNASMAKYN